MTKCKHTDDEFILIVKENFSIRAVLKVLGLAEAGGSYKTFHARVKRLNIDTSHFTGMGHLKGKTHNWNEKIPLKEILVSNSNYSNTSYLRKRLIKEELLTNECSRCKIKDWQEESLSLHLDHIDGDNTNNQIENLRLLCPNCHSQTSTYCGRNKKKC